MTDKALSSIQKTCRILKVLTDKNVMRLTDIARSAELDISTCSRILKDLEEEGFVEREPETKCYVLGPQVYIMHNSMIGGLCPKSLARPSMIRLAQLYLDTVILSVPSGWESVCLDLCYGNYPIRANYLSSGSRRPLGVGAGSLALIAALPDSELEVVLPLVEDQLDRYPAFDFSSLVQHIRITREKGYAVLLDVVVEKMGGISRVIRRPDGYPLAAISIAALSERITSREIELAHALEKEAQRIESVWKP